MPSCLVFPYPFLIEEATHIPVLASEVLDVLAPQPGETAVDLTCGLGGHTAALAARVGPSGLVIGFDRDPTALELTTRLVGDAAPFEPVHGNFITARRHLEKKGRRADVVLADLGFGSWQMDDARRGFSIGVDGPLDMRFDPGAAVSAADIIARSSEAELAEIIARYGEEPLARKIARKLTQTRDAQPIRSTAQLAALVNEVYGSRARRSRIHPATRTFMALRIAVNEEIPALNVLLDHIASGARSNDDGWLNCSARLAIIAFHSLEDRPIKRAFAELTRAGLATRLTPRPITATEAEIAANPRSRSAKLRAVRIHGLS